MSEFDATAPGTQQNITPMNAPKAMAVRTFMFAMTTDAGPMLMAFRNSSLLIGRLPDNHLGLNHSSVSRRHARISMTQKGMQIEDLGSQNGTTINGVAIKQPSPVRPGDIIRIGHVPLYYFGFINPDQPPKITTIENSVLVTPILPTMT